MFKKIMVVVLFMGVSFCGVVSAETNVPIAWDANTEEDLAGYKVYRGSVSGVYDGYTDVSNNTSYIFEGVPDNQALFISVTAYDSSGNESLFSNEVVFILDSIPPVKVGGLRIETFTIVTGTP